MAEEKIIDINIADEMKSAYIDYSMSVIVARALPDARDGLKPVHRRVLYGMSGLGLVYNKSHKKSARIVGEVLGKYHPHGDTSVYDAMVRMAQPWSLRYPLVDGQGNFGSMDGDNPAAMRYTEARMQRISNELLSDLDKETVDFRLNFDDTLEEPTVLPAKLPVLLLNGASGIAVGMSTDMLPHNLTEVINGTMAYIDNYDITIEELMTHITAPDFPTGGIIYGYEGIKRGYETGLGRVVLRAKVHIEERPNGGERIVITEIPYQVNKAVLLKKIADLANEKKIEGISAADDFSDRNGLCMVVDVRRDAMANVVLSKLYKYTQLQTSLRIGNIALVNNRPVVMNLKDMLVEFVKFRLEVITRRTQYELRKALERAHILEGILVALDYLDAVIALIRASKTGEEARKGLMEAKFLTDKEKAAGAVKIISISDALGEEFTPNDTMSEAQAKAILDMRLQKLVGLERDKVRGDYEEILKRIEHLRSILGDEQMRKDIIKTELTDILERFGDERRTAIEYSASDISIEDMIADEDVIITISHLGYIKRTAASEYRAQGRGGRGSKGSATRDTDYVEHIFSATAHNYLMFFTEQGRCFWMRVYEIPEGTKTSKGRVLQNVIQIPKDDKVKAYVKVEDLTDEEFLNNHYIMFCTRQGIVKKTPLEQFSRPRTNGINAITIREGDQLLEAILTTGTNDIVIGKRMGKAIRFPESKVRSMGRSAAGVRGVKLGGEEDRAIGMVSVNPANEDALIMVVSENGYGKRTLLSEYRETNRGGTGIKTLQVTDKTGFLVGIKSPNETDDLMITNKSGIMIRLETEKINIIGRATQGVRLINLQKNDQIADIAVIPHTDEEDEIELDENGQAIVVEASEDAQELSKEAEEGGEVDDSEE